MPASCDWPPRARATMRWPLPFFFSAVSSAGATQATSEGTRDAPAAAPLTHLSAFANVTVEPALGNTPESHAVASAFDLADHLISLRLGLGGAAQPDSSSSATQPGAPDAPTHCEAARPLYTVQVMQSMLARLFRTCLPSLHPADAVSICRALARAFAGGNTSAASSALSKLREVVSAALLDVREHPVVRSSRRCRSAVVVAQHWHHQPPHETLLLGRARSFRH